MKLCPIAHRSPLRDSLKDLNKKYTIAYVFMYLNGFASMGILAYFHRLLQNSTITFAYSRKIKLEIQVEN